MARPVPLGSNSSTCHVRYVHDLHQVNNIKHYRRTVRCTVLVPCSSGSKHASNSRWPNLMPVLANATFIDVSPIGSLSYIHRHGSAAGGINVMLYHPCCRWISLQQLYLHGTSPRFSVLRSEVFIIHAKSLLCFTTKFLHTHARTHTKFSSCYNYVLRFIKRVESPVCPYKGTGFQNDEQIYSHDTYGLRI